MHVSSVQTSLTTRKVAQDIGFSVLDEGVFRVIVLLPMIGKMVVSDLIQGVAEGILGMRESPRSVDIGRSTFCSDNLNETVGKRQRDGFGIVNDMIDRVWLVPKLAGVVGTGPRVGFIASVHWDAGLAVEELLDCGSCVWLDSPILLIKYDWFVFTVVDDWKCMSTW